ncbi:MAG: hypothetical protein AAFQ05_02115 [Pseudomonadota bacterium]
MAHRVVGRCLAMRFGNVAVFRQHHLLGDVADWLLPPHFEVQPLCPLVAVDSVRREGRARLEEPLERHLEGDAFHLFLALLRVGVVAVCHLAQHRQRSFTRHIRGEHIRAPNGDAPSAPVYLPFGKVDLGLGADPKAETGKHGVAVEDLTALSERDFVNGAAGKT